MKLAIKIILTCATFFLLNEIYSWHHFDEDVARFADQYHQVLKVKDADVIYFSASSNFGPDDGSETHPLKISQILSNLLGGAIQVEAVNKPASHLGSFNNYLALLPENATCETLVVTVNLRSFGPDWIHSELETSLNQAAVFYNQRPALFNRLLLSLRAYDDRSISERQALRNEAWNNAPLPFEAPMHNVTSWCAVEKWGDWRNPKRQLADQFIKQYGFVIDAQNPRVKDLSSLIERAKARKMQLVLHLLPENLERADELVGNELTSLMRENAAWLQETYKEDVIWIDNLDLLGDKHFRDRDFPTEHYDADGRLRIAERIKQAAF